jgi:N-methylhydantoinase B
MPVLYLYRREIANSGGAGKFNGSATLGIAFTAHKTDQVLHQVAACGVSHPTAMGISGGYAGPPTVYKFRRRSDPPRSLEGMLTDPKAQESLDLGALNTRRLAPKEFDLVQQPGDIYEAICSGAAGYGDPLERDPEAVRNDVALGYFDLDHAVKIFGVCLAPGANGEAVVDEAATTASRNRVRKERLQRARPPSQPAPSAKITEMVFELSDSLVIGRDAKGEFYYCSAPARRPLASLEDSYKLACSRLDLPLTDAGPFVGDPHELVDDDMQFRLFVCPFTGVLIETEIARLVDPPLQDVSVDKESLKRLVNSRRKLPMAAE